ncbi:MAG: DUF1622 domain-containing protein [Deltaproteobacteria bacterium]|nr:DUF1622 domain-containing protein [Deltaproteobacteria bacterium]
MEFEHVIDIVGRVIEVTGIVAIVIGIAASSTRWILHLREPAAYLTYRRSLGRALLLGLELLVAADIIRTVTTTASWESVGVLGVIVIIRTVLSWSITLEVEGRFPWQKEEKHEH